MASGDKEHKMLFDIRGRRRNVIKVVYAVLAVLMGLSLFLLAGPGIGGIFNSGESASNSEAVERLEDEAVRIERQIAKDPQNDDLMLKLTRNYVSAANLLAEPGPNEEAIFTTESRQQMLKASSVWSEYLETTDEPAAGAAQLMAQTLFSLANISRSYPEAVATITAAAEAQRIVAEQRPSIGTLSTSALYTLFTFEYAEAEKLLDEAKQFVNGKSERESLEKQYDETEKRAKEFEKEFKEAQKIEKQSEEAGGGGNPQQSLQNPLGLGGGSGLAE